MKFVFRGWHREVRPHKHDLHPVTFSNGKYRRGRKAAPLKWHSARTAYGQLENLGLSGRFLVELEFEPDELENWIRRAISDDPKRILLLLSRLQAAAIKEVLRNN